MVRAPLDSSCVRSAGYDGGTGELEVEFAGGAVYRYRGVPAPVYAGFLAAESHGRYFNRVIRDHFPYRRLPS